MYTIKTIKKTNMYKANVKKVRKIWPDHVEDFARELMIAANNSIKKDGLFYPCSEDISGCFIWASTPQGDKPWRSLSKKLEVLNG